MRWGKPDYTETEEVCQGEKLEYYFEKMWCKLVSDYEDPEWHKLIDIESVLCASDEAWGKPLKKFNWRKVLIDEAFWIEAVESSKVQAAYEHWLVEKHLLNSTS